MTADALTSFQKSHCVITGGAGFIGSHLAKRLVCLGAKVDLVDNLNPSYGGNLSNIASIASEVSLHRADVRDKSIMRELVESADYLFNLAGQTSHVDSMTDPWTDLETNALAQLDILEAIRQTNPSIRVVFASTRQIYGRPQYLPVDEMHPLRPVDVNGINKIAGESYHLLYGEVYGIPVSVLRLTNTYGPGMRVKDARQTFLGTWIKSAVEGGTFQVFGDGSQRRDYNYIEDVVEAFIQASIRDEAIGKALNLGSLEVVTLSETARMIVDIAAGAKFEIVPFPPERKAIDIGDYYGNWSLAKETLAWNPQVGLIDGLTRTIDFYRKHQEDYW